ncbi:hypothetical protein FOZ62_003639, partial [Perkinsus olseni]
MLMNDPGMASCYSCLFNSPLGACGPGGLQCLLPAIFICVINCLFDGIRFFGMISTTIHLAKLGFVVPMLLEISLFFSFVLQGVISWVAYKAFKQISASSSGGTSQPFLGGDPYAIGQPPAGPVSYQTTFGKYYYWGEELPGVAIGVVRLACSLSVDAWPGLQFTLRSFFVSNSRARMTVLKFKIVNLLFIFSRSACLCPRYRCSYRRPGQPTVRR